MTGLGKPPGCNNPEGYTGDNHERECPRCGVLVKSVPHHIHGPNCEVDE